MVNIVPAGWHKREYEAPGSRSTRKTLATVAEVLELTYLQRLPLGSWQDGLTDEPEKNSRMPAVYIAEDCKLWSQFEAKRRVCNSWHFMTTSFDFTAYEQSGWAGPLAIELRNAFAASLNPSPTPSTTS